VTQERRMRISPTLITIPLGIVRRDPILCNGLGLLLVILPHATGIV